MPIQQNCIFTDARFERLSLVTVLTLGVLDTLCTCTGVAVKVELLQTWTERMSYFSLVAVDNIFERCISVNILPPDLNLG